MDSKYPIGKWQCPPEILQDMIDQWIEDISELPTKLKFISNDCIGNEDKIYRIGGWNVKQLIHHLADSHINAYIRHKLAFTIDQPTINPYPEDKWARLEDVNTVDIGISVQLIDALHIRWVQFLKSLKGSDWKKSFFHPQSQRVILLEESVGMYAWHCNHHFAHLKIALGNSFND